jgi:hypothetical protein
LKPVADIDLPQRLKARVVIGDHRSVGKPREHETASSTPLTFGYTFDFMSPVIGSAAIISDSRRSADAVFL